MPTRDLTNGEDDELVATDDDSSIRVWVPFFPVYSELRHLLRVWTGRSRREVNGLQTSIMRLRGTPQRPVNWTDPAKWIPERLNGSDRDLAHAVWDQSNGTVNPRYIYGHWRLAQKYKLVHENNESILELTEFGRDFLEHSSGAAEHEIDEAQGLYKLLSIVESRGPGRASTFVGDWGDYLLRYSQVNAQSTIQSLLRYRLKNLLERGLVEKKGTFYNATPNGLDHLRKAGYISEVGGGNHNQVGALVLQQENRVREDLREFLHNMDPIAFEHLIKQLLLKMKYEDVEVTSQARDGGVDVVANAKFGITTVREVVQAKRHRRTIQRGILDALRGSLHRFDAERGTIITTSRFARGAQEAASTRGVAPITLIDGDKLLDLLIEHRIGVRQRSVKLLELDVASIVSPKAE